MFRRCTDAPKLQLVSTKSFGRRPQTGPLAGCVEPSPAAATVLGANAGLDLKKECCRKALHIGSWLMSVGPIQLRDKVLRNISAQAEAGACWLEALPSLLGRLETEWNIQVGRLFPNATEAFVSEAMNSRWSTSRPQNPDPRVSEGGPRTKPASDCERPRICPASAPRRE